MSGVRAALVLLAVITWGCTPRPWNFDETDRISEVMGRGEEDPASEATVRSVSAPELPDVDVIPYPRPVYVRPSNERRRSPTVRGKRFTAAERAKGFRWSGERVRPAQRTATPTKTR